MMNTVKRVALALGLTLVLGISLAHGDDTESPAEIEARPPAAEGVPIEPPRKPSGFWTSPKRAEGGAYRYRMLGVGLGVLALSGGIAIYLVKRTPPPSRHG